MKHQRLRIFISGFTDILDGALKIITFGKYTGGLTVKFIMYCFKKDRIKRKA